jgi:competence protein ComEA
VTLYTSPQFRLLLILALALLTGLGVREWRAGFPALAERLERFDREDPPTPLPAQPLREPPAPRRGARAANDVDLERASRPRATGTAEIAAGSRARRSPASDPPTATDPRPLDLNAASVEQIARLPGIGPALARRIVEERDRRGRFDSAGSLRGVLGLGPKKLAAVRDLITVTEAEGAR